ncbi:MAG: hypothetical protein UD936_01265, partial [Acutalibacteraceae bacterium]|nr:hypothetical protein [Acutalibacteraceae bacterium]
HLSDRQMESAAKANPLSKVKMRKISSESSNENPHENLNDNSGEKTHESSDENLNENISPGQNG